ncbi:MAG: hypothetical protein CK548_03825 [Opitutia bacterium]|nr:MAG: hypothetical protein CK548_03825 [Opitutae bacterium]
MTVYLFCILFSSLSFFAYVAAYFIDPKMKQEFKRFKMEKLGIVIIIFEFLGALGLLLGLKYDLFLSLSSLGLGLTMFCGVLVRLLLKDSLWIIAPALFYMVLNFYIFTESL